MFLKKLPSDETLSLKSVSTARKIQQSASDVLFHEYVTNVFPSEKTTLQQRRINFDATSYSVPTGSGAKLFRTLCISENESQ